MYQEHELSRIEKYIEERFSEYRKLDYILLDSNKIDEFFKWAFKSNAFKQLLKSPTSILHNYIEEIKKFPLIIRIQKDNDDIVRRYTFTTYHRVLTLRTNDYTDKSKFLDGQTLHDLYLLHELTHMATLNMHPADSPSEWRKKMIDNELYASFTSEAFIYFLSPGLREKTISEELWVDRYLQNKKILSSEYKTNIEFYESDPDKFAKKLFEKYTKVYIKFIDECDPQEKHIAYYRDKNNKWLDIWEKDFAIFEQACQRFKNSNYQSKEGYVDWLIAQEKELFLPKAIAYAKLYDPSYSLDIASSPKDKTNVSVYSFFKKRTLDSSSCDLEKLFISQKFNAALHQYTEGLQKGVDNHRIEMTDNVRPTIELFNKGIPLTTTIYSLFSEEVYKCIEATNLNTTLLWSQDNNFERKQDESHMIYLQKYKEWTKEVVNGLEGYTHQYFSNGSSEGISKALTRIKNEVGSNKEAVLHVFEGEYEGAIHYAKCNGFTVKKHPRPEGASFRNVIGECHPNEYWYISQPSGLDGNIWPFYDDFLEQASQAGQKFIIDLAYLGTVAKDYHINVFHPNIDTVVGSLSKLGPYYERIGFCFSRVENNLLTGNKWFKNLHSIDVALEIMDKISIKSLAKTYQEYQRVLVTYMNNKYGFSLVPSDVFLVATQKCDIPNIMSKYPELNSCKREHGYIRVCLTGGLRAMTLVEGFEQQNEQEHEQQNSKRLRIG